MKLYGLKNCDTCRKALRALPEITFIDVRKDGVPLALLKRAYLQFGDTLINKRSTTWRGLSEQDRMLSPLVLLETHPSLMKRPLIETDSRLHLGWDAAVQKDLQTIG